MTKTTKVANARGNAIDFDAAVKLMDDEIREDIHLNYEPGFDNPQEFFNEYARRHEMKFGEGFVPFVGGAW